MTPAFPTRRASGLPGPGAPPAPGPDPAHVVGAPQPDDRRALVLGAGDRHLGRLAADGLAVAHVAVEQQVDAVVGDHGRLHAELHGAGAGVFHVARCQADDVAVVAHQIGFDQVACDRLGLYAVAARSLDHARDEVGQALVPDDHRMLSPLDVVVAVRQAGVADRRGCTRAYTLSISPS